MNKLATLVTGGLLLSLTACGTPINPATTQLTAPRQAQATPNLQANSVRGILSEMKKGVQESFAKKDVDQDGFIIPKEFPVESPSQELHFRRLDGNKDGKVSVKEMDRGLFSKIKDVAQIKMTAAFLFDELDVNNDRQLSAEEVSASTLPGVAANYSNYLTKSWYNRSKRTYLRRTDFENLVAFALLNPTAKK